VERVSRQGPPSPTPFPPKFTHLCTLTFFVHYLPREIKVGCLQALFKPYIPNPMRCAKCMSLGHHGEACRSKPACNPCGHGKGSEIPVPPPCCSTFTTGPPNQPLTSTVSPGFRNTLYGRSRSPGCFSPGGEANRAGKKDRTPPSFQHQHPSSYFLCNLLLLPFTSQKIEDSLG
jgi:hypothetical protein